MTTCFDSQFHLLFYSNILERVHITVIIYRYGTVYGLYEIDFHLTNQVIYW